MGSVSLEVSTCEIQLIMGGGGELGLGIELVTVCLSRAANVQESLV